MVDVAVAAVVEVVACEEAAVVEVACEAVAVVVSGGWSRCPSRAQCHSKHSRFLMYRRSHCVLRAHTASSATREEPEGAMNSHKNPFADNRGVGSLTLRLLGRLKSKRI